MNISAKTFNEEQFNVVLGTKTTRLAPNGHGPARSTCRAQRACNAPDERIRRACTMLWQSCNGQHNQKLQIANNNTLKFEWISMLVRTAPRKAKTINQRIMLTTGTKQTFQMPKKQKTRKNPSGKNKLLDMKRAFYRRKILIIGILRAVGLIFSTSAKKKNKVLSTIKKRPRSRRKRCRSKNMTSNGK